MFKPTALDFELSPYTGLTRESWLEAAKYMLGGVFKHIKDFEDPVIVPRTEDAITYPHPTSPADQYEAEVKAEMFEGLTRTFFIAAPLIANEPEVTLNGYKLSDYYKNQILKSVTEGDKCFVGTYESLQETTNHADPFRAFQQTVETCALVICLYISKPYVWDRYTKEEKDRIAALLSSFGHANTVPQNWRLFNMLDLAFLHMEGYKIDKAIMADHTQAILNYYVGDGWYRDGQSFDYYSNWAFNVYGPLWNLWYGYENDKKAAKRIEDNSNKLMETYADFFDKDGFTNMWGRSNIYRFAATSAFDANFFLKNPKADPGLARRIASGSLLQFLSRDDVIIDGVPSLGFYRTFAPLVQGYSCAESPFWMGKAFLCLHLPKDHPFWTAKENNGTWDRLTQREVKETCLSGPALCFSDHEANGETILRTGKVVKRKDDIHGVWNYGKLCYNTKFPWESSVAGNECEAQQYVLKDVTTGSRDIGNATFWAGEKAGVLYRRQFFGYSLEREEHWIQAINLADFTVPYGIIRVDRHRLHRRPVEFVLGSYGFPDNGTKITRLEKDGANAILLEGFDHRGTRISMAMTVYSGFDSIEVEDRIGTDPDSEKSKVIYAKGLYEKQYDGHAPYLLISQVITKTGEGSFTEDDIFPILKIQTSDKAGVGAYGNVTISLKNGTKKRINYDHIEANMSL